MSRIKGIIFDFNGTLLWDTPYHNKAWNIFLDRYHITLSDQEIRDNMHGRTNAEIFKYLFKKDLSLGEVNTLAAEKRGDLPSFDYQQQFRLTTWIKANV